MIVAPGIIGDTFEQISWKMDDVIVFFNSFWLVPYFCAPGTKKIVEDWWCNIVFNSLFKFFWGGAGIIGNTIEQIKWKMDPTNNKDRRIRHEAAHMMCGYMCGLPLAGKIGLNTKI